MVNVRKISLEERIALRKEKIAEEKETRKLLAKEHQKAIANIRWLKTKLPPPIEPLSQKDMLRLFQKIRVTRRGCFEWQGSCGRNGYGQTTYKGKPVKAHRLFYSLFKGKLIDGLYICHECDNPKCVNPKHLFQDTAKENMHDCFIKGRHTNIFKPGGKPKNRRLDDNTAAKILLYIVDHPEVPGAEIARKFEVSRFTVYDMKKGTAYNNLIEHYPELD